MPRFDRSLFEKIADRQTYYKSYEEYKNSVIYELENILSCRLRDSYRDLKESPYAYGIRDFLSQEISTANLELFKKEIQMIIKALDPRIFNIEIIEIKVNFEKQALEFSIDCVLKGGKFQHRVSIHKE